MRFVQPLTQLLQFGSAVWEWRLRPTAAIDELGVFVSRGTGLPKRGITSYCVCVTRRLDCLRCCRRYAMFVELGSGSKSRRCDPSVVGVRRLGRNAKADRWPAAGTGAWLHMVGARLASMPPIQGATLRLTLGCLLSECLQIQRRHVRTASPLTGNTSRAAGTSVLV